LFSSEFDEIYIVKHSRLQDSIQWIGKRTHIYVGQVETIGSRMPMAETWP